MNWDAIGAIGEVIGALAVVISVIYLAVQVRAGSAALSTNLRDSVFNSFQAWNGHFTADAELAEMFHRGLRDFDALTELERPRFLHTAFSYFKMYENLYLHFLDGAVGEEVWIHNRELMFAFSKMPGGQYYLDSRANAFDPRFMKELNANSGQNVPAPDIVSEGPKGDQLVGGTGEGASRPNKSLDASA